MVELEGDLCFPSDLGLPIETTTSANAMSGLKIVSGLIIWNTTLKKIDVWTGTQWETVTSVGRA